MPRSSMVLLSLVLVAAPSATVPAWEQVVGGSAATAGGFGDVNNTIALSSATFGSWLYVGTFNAITGTEVWRSTNGTQWTKVNSDGFGHQDNQGAYSMAVFDTNPAYLYVGTWASDIIGTDTRMWRSSDGGAWAQANTDGFGDGDNAEPWSMVVFGGYLYVGVANYPDGAEIMSSHNGLSWGQANTNGFGTTNNKEITSMAVFGPYVYAATRNDVGGVEVYRSDTGFDWGSGPVNTAGFGTANNYAAYAMAVFDGYLYLATSNEITGTQVWRSSNGTSWAQVSTGGFGDANNRAVYAMEVYGGALIVGTLNWTTGAEVWSTTTGTTWTQVNSNGFGSASNSAVHTLSEHGGNLYAGLRTLSGGCQVWRVNGTIMVDGFESGNFSGWTSVVP